MQKRSATNTVISRFGDPGCILIFEVLGGELNHAWALT